MDQSSHNTGHSGPAGQSGPAGHSGQQPPVVPHPGAVLDGRFELRSMLGEGAFSTVWIAWDRFLKCEIALKVLRAHAVGGFLDEIAREVRTGRTLSHPSIVRVFELHPEVPAISMELVRGGSLKEAKKPKGFLHFSELAPLSAQICDALMYAHEDKGVAHRDLKPANILIDSADGRAKISDFGLAVRLREETLRAGDGSGTPAFMGPQQLLGKLPDPLDDVYSLGATLYDVLAGTPPFEGAAVLDQILHQDPQPISERLREKGINAEPIPPNWEQAVLSCLAKDPNARPQSVRELVERMNTGTPQIVVPQQSPQDLEESLQRGERLLGNTTKAEASQKPVSAGIPAAAPAGIPAGEETTTVVLSPDQQAALASSHQEATGEALTGPAPTAPAPAAPAPTVPTAENGKARSNPVRRWAPVALIPIAALVVFVFRFALTPEAPGPAVAEAAPEKDLACFPEPMADNSPPSIEETEVVEEPTPSTPEPEPYRMTTFEIELSRHGDLTAARQALQRLVASGVSARRVELSPGGPYAIRLGNNLSQSDAKSMARRVLGSRGIPYQIVEVQ